VVAERDEHGRFIKGAATPNPGGRPKGLAERARAACKDGDELVAYMASVLRDEGQETRDRIKAVEWLADRGWGKAVQAIEHSGANGEPFSIRYVNDWRNADSADN
jgi:hypothetical protein